LEYYFKTKFYGELCNKINISFNNKSDIQILLESITTRKNFLVDENNVLQEEYQNFHQELKSKFSQYQPQLQQQEHFIRKKHNDVITYQRLGNSTSFFTKVRYRNYQREAIKVINKYDSVYRSLFMDYRSFEEQLLHNKIIMTQLDQFQGIMTIYKDLHDFEGAFFIYELFSLVISTSGIHIIYISVPKGFSEDSFRNLLLENLIDYFSNFFGKSINLVLELYNIQQYRSLVYEDLPDTIKIEDLAFFIKILDSNPVKITFLEENT
jgi:hypothetical protein